MPPSRRIWGLTFASGALLGTIGWVDYISGPDIGFSLFYILPVLAAGWYVGRRSALVAALIASLVWFAADLSWRGADWLPVTLWNWGTRLAIFVLLGLLAANQRRAKAALEATQATLQQALAREEQLSRTDPLTGLANGRAFLETLKRELDRARRAGAALCVAYLDIDNFKRVNDTRGHNAGDLLLHQVATALREEIRGGDVAARLAGDEFAVLLWNADRTQVERVAERWIRRIGELGAEQPELGLGASVGIAWFSSAPETEDEVVKAADAAMYRAKAAGKNRVALEVQGDPAERSPGAFNGR